MRPRSRPWLEGLVGFDPDRVSVTETQDPDAVTDEEVAAMFDIEGDARTAYVEWDPAQHPRGEGGRFTFGDDVGAVADTMRGGDSVSAMMRALVEPDSGMTIDLTGSVPDRGYVVAVEGRSKAIPAAEFTKSREAAVQAVDDFLAANADELNANASVDGQRMLGLWHNPETGNVVFDVVEVIEDRETALRLGAERDQIAIYGIAEGEVISTGGTGGSQASAGPPSRYGRRRPGRPDRPAAAGGADRRRAPPGSDADEVDPR